MRLRPAWLSVLPMTLCACQVLAQPALAPQGNAATGGPDLFEQAFGKRRARAVQRLLLPTSLDGREIGPLDAVLGPQGLSLTRKPLADALKGLLKPEVYSRLLTEGAAPQVSQAELKSLGIEAEYSAQRISVDLTVPLELREVQVLRLDSRGWESANGDQTRIAAERFSLIINGRWAASEQTSSGPSVRRSRLFGDSAARIGDWVVQGNGSLATDGTGGFERYGTSAVRDWPDAAIRLSLGDVSNAPRGAFSTLAMGGLHVGRQFGLNPLISSQPQPAQVIGLPGGASVDVVVNGFVVRTVRLTPGVYDLRNIPVFNGANDVVIRVVEPGARVTEQRMSYFFDSSLLAKGMTDWDVALGLPVAPGPGSRTYASGQQSGSAWWRRGWSDTITAGAGIQWNSTALAKARVAQAEGAWANPLGTVSAWAAQSSHPWGNGHAVSAQWRANSTATPMSTLAASFTGQWTRRNANFANVDALAATPASTDRGLRGGLAWGAGWAATLAATWRSSTDPASTARSQTLTLRKRLDRHWSAEAGVAHTVAGMASGMSNGFVSLRYSGDTDPDGTSARAAMSYLGETRRWQADADATGVTSLAGADAAWRVSGSQANMQGGNESTLRGELYTGRGEATWSATQSRAAVGGATGFQEFSMAAALVVSRTGMRLSAPVPDSAAVLVPRKGLEDLKLLVDPRRDRVTSSDAFGAPVLYDLIAYSPREVQLDVDKLPPGRSLGDDRPLLMPAYRSVLLIPVGSDANTQVSGRLLGPQQQALPLRSLRLVSRQRPQNPVELFTNRRGGFTSPPLPAGNYQLLQAGELPALATFEIGEDQSGLVNLGNIVIKELSP